MTHQRRWLILSHVSVISGTSVVTRSIVWLILSHVSVILGNFRGHEIYCIEVPGVWALVDLRTVMTHRSRWLIGCHVWLFRVFPKSRDDDSSGDDSSGVTCGVTHGSSGSSCIGLSRVMCLNAKSRYFQDFVLCVLSLWSFLDRIQVISGFYGDLSICVALARTGETARSKVWDPLHNIPPPLKIAWSL